MKIILMQQTLMYFSKLAISIPIPDDALIEDKVYIKDNRNIYYSVLTLT